MECRRGDIYFVDFGRDTESNLQCGVRPALVVSNNRANENSPSDYGNSADCTNIQKAAFPYPCADPEDLWYRSCQKQHGTGRTGQHH